MSGLRNDLIDDVRRLVAVESPSDDLQALRRVADELSALAAERTRSRVRRDEVAGRPIVRIGADTAPVLMIGHLDTVHPVGSLRRQPVVLDGDRLTGPGVFDMKSGIVIGLHALAAGANASLLVTSDEELGTPWSRPVIEDAARRARCVLVLEPAVGDAVKSARKGVARFTVHATGRAAHAGLEPERGANALVALGHAVMEVAQLGRPDLGTTVTPTTATAGSSLNTVPERASFTVDVRAWTVDEQHRVAAALAGLVSAVPGVSLSTEPGAARPPFEASMSRRLFEIAQEAAAAVGLPPLVGQAVGGGSDGNLTAALGVPTLDGLGGVGGGAHRPDEWLDVRSLVDRCRLVVELVQRIVDAPPTGLLAAE